MRCPRHLLALLAACAARLTASAQDDEQHVILDAGMANHDVFRGVLVSDALATESVELRQATWHARLEGGQALRSGDPGSLGLEAGYAWPLEASGVTVGLQANQRWFTNTSAGACRQITEAGITLGRAGEGGFQPGVAIFHDFRRQAETVEASVGYEWALTRLGAYLEARLFAGWSTARNLHPDVAGPKFEDSYGYGGVRLRLPYRFGAHSSVVLAAELTDTAGQDPAWSPIRHAGGVIATGRLGVSVDF
jgi:hypothetical protein